MNELYFKPDIKSKVVYMRIAVGSDHAGFHLKNVLRDWLLNQGHEVEDVGTFTAERADYPIYGAAAAAKVGNGDAELAVVVCGSGQGICMAANKVPGVRAGVIRDEQDAQMSRAHNDANVACFGERVTDSDTAINALRVFLTTEFEGGRHQNRVDLLGELDTK
jgi:ribose 5-phosphate isomerase B